MQVTSFSRGRIARFGSGGAFLRSCEPLTDDMIMLAAPSVFAEAKHESRSARYAYIPTAQLLVAMRKEGFEAFEVRQGGSRDDEKRGFTKHLIRFRHAGGDLAGDSKREVVLVNSHDGTTSYQLMSGVFRTLCSNGLVVCEGEAKKISIPHKGNVIDNVIEGSFRIIDDSAAVEHSIRSMQSLELSPAEQNLFAHSALMLRYEEGKSPFEAPDLNVARRTDDRGPDLWRTFNRIQENVMRGGISYVQRDENGRRVARRETRPVNSVDGNVKLNQALWALAEGMKKLKAA